MKISIRGKLFALSMFSVLVTTVAISITYYVLISQDEHQKSQQRIHIAFMIIFDDVARLSKECIGDIEEFIQQEDSFPLAASLPFEQITRSGIQRHLNSLLVSLSAFAKLDHISVFTVEGHQLATYLKSETTPSDTTSHSEAVTFEETIPEQATTELYRVENRIGLRIVAPIRKDSDKDSNIVGVLVAIMFLTPEMAERYATLSETAVNFFVDTTWSLGTLPGQSELDPDLMRAMPSCDSLLENSQHIVVSSIHIDGQEFSQGGCTVANSQGYIGAMTVSLSEALQELQMRRVVKIIVGIALLSIVGGSGLSALFSHKSILAIQESVRVITAASEGDLRFTATAKTRDEIGTLASSLNVMTGKLRDLFQQVQHASYTIHGTADTIFAQMEALTRHMGQQTQSVETTAGSIENITQFMNTVAENASVLLSASSQILASIQETRASISEITQSTGALSMDLQQILMSVDNVNQSVKQISDQTEQLEETTHATDAEMQQIDQFFQEVSTNAERTQHLAKETMHAATRGERSVEAALQGMTEMKDVVTDTARIMQDISSWGEQVSGILGMVDDITEQTSLLALNASIISAQAGAHGRGFAVVADEIKNLATRTKSSTHEIGALIHKLHQNTKDGVQRAQNGLLKADQGMQLVRAVNVDLREILDRATQSAERATNNVLVVQQTITRGQIISDHITHIAGMVSIIRQALQQGKTEFEQVVSSVENISGMAEQVSRANLEQKRASEEIEKSMTDITIKFSDISDQTDALQRDAQHIVSAVKFVKSTTEEISQNTAQISEKHVQDLVQQSELLQSLVRIFKIT